MQRTTYTIKSTIEVEIQIDDVVVVEVYTLVVTIEEVVKSDDGVKRIVMLGMVGHRVSILKRIS